METKQNILKQFKLFLIINNISIDDNFNKFLNDIKTEYINNDITFGQLLQELELFNLMQLLYDNNVVGQYTYISFIDDNGFLELLTEFNRKKIN